MPLVILLLVDSVDEINGLLAVAPIKARRSKGILGRLILPLVSPEASQVLLDVVKDRKLPRGATTLISVYLSLAISRGATLPLPLKALSMAIIKIVVIVLEHSLLVDIDQLQSTVELLHSVQPVDLLLPLHEVLPKILEVIYYRL